MIGHITPESVDGGNLALVKEGDQIEIDLKKQEINVLLTPQELAQRRSAWIKPVQKSYLNMPTNVLSKYAKLVKSASFGAIVE
jgi:dihydroxy-acid dehydratase